MSQLSTSDDLTGASNDSVSTPSNEPQVALVILTMNQLDHTHHCLTALRNISYKNCAIILVDNGSTDGTTDTVLSQFPEVHLVRCTTNHGVAGGRNIGIRHAEKFINFKYLLIIDNDTLPERDFLRELVAACEHDQTAGLAFPKVSYMDNPDILQYADNLSISLYTGRYKYPAYKQIDRGQFDQPCYSMLGTGACMLIRRDVLFALKGFDEVFNPYGFEDVDFSLRARKKGFKILYVPTARILHKESLSASGGKYNAYYAALKGKQIKIFFKRHATPLQFVAFQFLAPFTGLNTAFREIRRGNFSAVVTLFKSYLFSK